MVARPCSSGPTKSLGPSLPAEALILLGSAHCIFVAVEDLEDKLVAEFSFEAVEARG